MCIETIRVPIYVCICGRTQLQRSGIDPSPPPPVLFWFHFTATSTHHPKYVDVDGYGEATHTKPLLQVGDSYQIFLIKLKCYCEVIFSKEIYYKKLKYETRIVCGGNIFSPLYMQRRLIAFFLLCDFIVIWVPVIYLFVSHEG